MGNQREREREVVLGLLCRISVRDMRLMSYYLIREKQGSLEIRLGWLSEPHQHTMRSPTGRFADS